MNKEAKNITWVNTEDELPKEDGLYIATRDGRWKEALTWNSHYKVWDDAEGDDYCCDAMSVKYWHKTLEVGEINV